MQNVSEGFSSIFSELDRLREMTTGMGNMVKLLENELATERAERKRLQALVTQIKDHAQMIAEEAERGEPIVPLPGVELRLIEPDVRDDLSLKLAAIDALASIPFPEQQTAVLKNPLADSFVL